MLFAVDPRARRDGRANVFLEWEYVALLFDGVLKTVVIERVHDKVARTGRTSRAFIFGNYQTITVYHVSRRLRLYNIPRGVRSLITIFVIRIGA